MSSDVEEIDMCDDDSDAIDSDLETELYSLVHHETNLSTSNHCSVNSLDNKLEIIKYNHILTREKEFKVNGKNVDDDTTMSHHSQTMKIDHQLSNKSQERPNPLPATLCKSTNRANLKDFLSIMETSSDSSSQELCSESQSLSNSNSGTKSKKRKSTKNALVKKTAVVSDSDSVITLSDDDTKPKSDLIMNFNGKMNMDIFDLDSSSDDSLSSKMINFYNDDSESAGISDPWYYSPLDMDLKSKTKARKFMNRYYCCKCKKHGHPKQFCTLNNGLKCSICAGDHSFYTCRNQICGKCYQVGHFSRQCSFKVYLICARCGMKGHKFDDCPDLWRRFHLTTSNSTQLEETPKLPQYRSIYCFNCGEEGHFGPTCKNSRSCNLPYPTWPAVISYEDPITEINLKLAKTRTKQVEKCPKPCTKNPIAKIKPKLTKEEKRKEFKLTKADIRKKRLEEKYHQSTHRKVFEKFKLSIMGPSRNQTRKEYMLNNAPKNCTLKSNENDFPRTPKALSDYSEESQICKQGEIKVKGKTKKSKTKRRHILYY